jgi:hypothetical protein
MIVLDEMLKMRKYCDCVDVKIMKPAGKLFPEKKELEGILEENTHSSSSFTHMQSPHAQSNKRTMDVAGFSEYFLLSGEKGHNRRVPILPIVQGIAHACWTIIMMDLQSQERVDSFFQLFQESLSRGQGNDGDCSYLHHKLNHFKQKFHTGLRASKFIPGELYS